MIVARCCKFFQEMPCRIKQYKVRFFRYGGRIETGVGSHPAVSGVVMTQLAAQLAGGGDDAHISGTSQGKKLRKTYYIWLKN
jgi:hypothetical protein